MNKFDRIISILMLLQSKNIITASVIADRFEISLRTVYRDIDTLKKAGIPITGDPGIGYSVMEGYRLPPVMFSEEEAMSLLTAEKFMSNITDLETQQHYTAAMTKIKAVLRSAEKEALDILDDAIAIAPVKSESHKPFLQDLFKSIASRNLLQIEYTKADGSVSKRTIEPQGCYNHSNKWYLIAYCRAQADYRTFKMNRIQQIRTLEDAFKKRDFNLQQYLEASNASWKSQMQTQIVEVLFDYSVVEHADRRKYYFGLMDEAHLPQGVQMKFWAYSLELMARWLVPFTNRATIIQPEALKEKIKNLSLELYDHYHANQTISKK